MAKANVDRGMRILDWSMDGSAEPSGEMMDVLRVNGTVMVFENFDGRSLSVSAIGGADEIGPAMALWERFIDEENPDWGTSERPDEASKSFADWLEA